MSIISAEFLQNLLKSAAEFMKYFRRILENLPRKTGGTDRVVILYMTVCLFILKIMLSVETRVYFIISLLKPFSR